MTFDLDLYIEKCYKRQLLEENVVKELCEKTKEVLLQESNLRRVQSPVVLVGDIHGQFYDLLEIFRIAGKPPDTNYLFLGDYVDRGYYSVELISLLVCLKLKWPDRITLIRGNHETRSVTQTYGFFAECNHKYGNVMVWNYFTDLFDFLVLGAIIDDCIWCVHGGLSPSIHTLDQIRIINRFREIPRIFFLNSMVDEGPMADLVWSDPVPTPSASIDTPDHYTGDFAISPRGAGYTFGETVTHRFLHTNQLLYMVRAHQLCMQGYQRLFQDTLCTVWSAPNYCYRAGNKASVLNIHPNLEREFIVFGPCPDELRELPKKNSTKTTDKKLEINDIGPVAKDLNNYFL